ncbi:MAG: LemA family protein [Clostridium sp.]
MPIALIVIAVVVVLILFWVISTYNKFVKLQNKVEEAFSTMDVYLKKRNDLIPNLVETIRVMQSMKRKHWKRSFVHVILR